MTYVFKHPKYYTELRKRNKSDQALGPGTVKLFRGSRILELEACGFKLDACCLGLDACRLMLQELGA